MSETSLIPKLKIKPVGDRILVQSVEGKEQVRGGVIIPDRAKEKSQEAKIVALGTGTTAKDGTTPAFEVQVGDTVLLGRSAGSEVTLDSEKYTLVREDDILAIIA